MAYSEAYSEAYTEAYSEVCGPYFHCPPHLYGCTHGHARASGLRGCPMVIGRPECVHDLLVCLYVRPAHELDAVGDGPEHLVKRLPYGLWLARQVDDERAATYASSLAAEHRSRNVVQADGPHLLPIACQGQGGRGRH